MVEGKIDIWIKRGSFSYSNDLYVKVLADNRQVWKTDESDSSSPEWNSKCAKHIKGDYEHLIFQLLDEDTFRRDDLLGSVKFPMDQVINDGIDGDFEMCNADDKPIGTISLYVKIEPGDVSLFDLMGSRIWNEDDD